MLKITKWICRVLCLFNIHCFTKDIISKYFKYNGKRFSGKGFKVGSEYSKLKKTTYCQCCGKKIKKQYLPKKEYKNYIL